VRQQSAWRGDDFRPELQRMSVAPTQYRRLASTPRMHRRVAMSPIHRAAIAKKKVAAKKAAEHATVGVASFYWQGSKTANGEKFNPRELTAAHRTLPFGTRIRVTDVTTGRSVTVRVNDRGPFIPGRIVDVSAGAAESLGMAGRGLAKVKLDVVP